MELDIRTALARTFYRASAVHWGSKLEAAGEQLDIMRAIAREAVEAHADKQQSIARAIAGFGPMVPRGESLVARALADERDLAMGREIDRLRAELERVTGELAAANAKIAQCLECESIDVTPRGGERLRRG